MSAIALHDVALQDIRIPGSRPTRRNHLRVVQPGEVAAVDAAIPSRQLVLTRRGRLAITLSTATVVVLALAAMLGMLPAMAAGGHTVTVEPGQTLSHIAVAELPDMPMDQAIVAIQLANNMSSLDVQAGATLEIPQP